MIRDPTPTERAVLVKLLSHEFAGSVELRRQCDGLKVEGIVNEKSLLLHPQPAGPPAVVSFNPPVEARALDSDGVPIHIVLYVKDGLLSELELFREDSKPIDVLPEADMLEVY
jgi:uncharacterized protein DUF6984